MNLIYSLPYDTSLIWLFAGACVLLAISVFLCFKPYFPAGVPGFLSLLLGSWSGFVPVSGEVLWFWGVASSLTLVLYYLLPKAIARSSRGLMFLAPGALAGALVGVAISSVTAIVVGSVIGAAFGALVFYRSNSSADIRTSSNKFFNYLLAKVFPLVINFSMIGIFIAVLAAVAGAS